MGAWRILCIEIQPSLLFINLFQIVFNLQLLSIEMLRLEVTLFVKFHVFIEIRILIYKLQITLLI